MNYVPEFFENQSVTTPQRKKNEFPISQKCISSSTKDLHTAKRWTSFNLAFNITRDGE